MRILILEGLNHSKRHTSILTLSVLIQKWVFYRWSLNYKTQHARFLDEPVRVLPYRITTSLSLQPLPLAGSASRPTFLRPSLLVFLCLILAGSASTHTNSVLPARRPSPMRNYTPFLSIMETPCLLARTYLRQFYRLSLSRSAELASVTAAVFRTQALKCYASRTTCLSQSN